MKKNIMIHACTNFGVSNFGDYLFADMVYSYIININDEGLTRFFQLSNFFGNRLFSKREKQKFNLFRMDALVYFAGGYWGDRQVPTAKSKIQRFIQYMPIGLLAAILRKPIAIIGVGAGPLNSAILRKSAKFIFNRASVITVRDNESKQFLEEIGVVRDIKVLSDVVHSFDLKMMPPIDTDYLNYIKEKIENKRIVFFHCSNNEKVRNMFAKGLNLFLKKNKDYGVIVASDEENKNYEILFENLRSQISTSSICNYKYNKPWELCSIINICDIVITHKLHVGIVGAKFGKSVISFPLHKDKINRYYIQISETGRCIPFDEIDDPQVIAAQMERYCTKRINLSDDVYNLSALNWDYLKNFLERLK